MKKITLKLTGGKYNNRQIINYNFKTRTTASIVRAAVFNMISLSKGVVLDLFAGSGSYGFESLSRSFSKVYFNDYNQLAVKAIKENAKSLNCLNNSFITKLNYKEALIYYQNNNILFDLCFIDPPYEMSFNEIELILTSLIDQINKGGEIIVERKKESPTYNVSGLSLFKLKNYGSRQIQIYQKL